MIADDMGRLEAYVAPLLEEAAEAGATAEEAIERRAPPAQALLEEVARRGYPFGPLWNFGIEFSEDDITVHAGILYHAGVPYEWPGTVPGDVTVAGLTDGQYVCVRIADLEMTPIISVVALATRGDTDGDVVRALCKVAVSGGMAKLTKWYGGGVELGAKGNQ